MWYLLTLLGPAELRKRRFRTEAKLFYLEFHLNSLRHSMLSH